MAETARGFLRDDSLCFLYVSLRTTQALVVGACGYWYRWVHAKCLSGAAPPGVTRLARGAGLIERLVGARRHARAPRRPALCARRWASLEALGSEDHTCGYEAEAHVPVKL